MVLERNQGFIFFSPNYFAQQEVTQSRVYIFWVNTNKEIQNRITLIEVRIVEHWCNVDPKDLGSNPPSP